MQRRKALMRIWWLVGGSLVSFAGYKWVKFNTVPSLDFLLGQKSLIASLVDVIIPKTDSPSASECNVHDFVIKMVIECTDVHTQNNFVSGLAELEEYSLSEFKKSFVECSEIEKNNIVSHHYDTERQQGGIIGKLQKRLSGKLFLYTLREYTVIGYFTSEQGATKALRYSHIPSKYIACQPYATGEKAWATF